MQPDEYSITFQKWAESIDPSYHSHRQGMVGPGWLPLLVDCMAELKSIGWDGGILQIKEKFGVLRLYISGTTPSISEVVNRYEERSRTVCEECGDAGEMRNTGGWLSTLCEKHFADRLAARDRRGG